MKRIIVLMLACLMLLSVVPFAVFAEEDVHEAETEATTEQIVCPKAKTVTNKTHTVTAVKTQAPQCGVNGYTLYSCSCGELFLDSYVAAAEGETHNYELVKEGTAATCSKAGKEDAYKCSVCGDEKGGKTIDATGKHNYVKDGESIVCEFCGKAQEDVSECEKDANGVHNWNYAGYTNYVAPTCAKEGSAKIACANEGCKATKTIVIEATGDHKYGDLIKAEAATCTEAGWEAHYICETCNHYFNTSFKDVVKDEDGNDVAYNPTIEKLGHKYACTEKEAVVTCLTCKKEVLATEATVNHSALKAIDTKATCTTYGVLVHTCAACGLNETVSRTEPTGHEFSEEYTVDDTNKCGLIINVHKCTNVDENTNVACTEEKKVPTNTATHTWETKVLVEATCTIKEKVGNICTVCEFEDESTYVYGSMDSQNHVNKAGEDVVPSSIVPATCTQTGSGLLVCDACGTQEIVVLPATGHNFAYFDADGDDLGVDCGYTVVEGQTAKAVCQTPNCGYTVENATIVVPAHTKGDEIGSGVANCITAAYKKYDCTVCTVDIYEYTGEKLPYNPAKDTYSTVAEAEKVHGVGSLTRKTNDCTLGQLYYACANCNQVVTIIPVGAGAPHTYPSWYRCDLTIDPATNVATFGEGNDLVTYGKLACVVCDTKLDVLTNDHKWVLDTESVDRNGKKLTYAPVCNKTAANDGAGNKHYVCENAYCVATKDEVVDGLTHDYKVVNAGKVASCLLASEPEVKVCSLCGDKVTATVVEATGHKYADTALVVAPTCEKAGYTFIECVVCMYEYAKSITAPTGHINAAKETLTYACDDKAEDRVCVNTNCDYKAKENKIPTHTLATGTEVKGTCTTQGYTIEICTKCDDYEKIVLSDNFGVHKYATDGAYKNLTEAKIIEKVVAATTLPAGVIYTPVLYKDGKIEFACEYCEVIDETKTIVVSAESILKDNYGKTIGMTLAVDNANKAGAGFSDSSIVAVTVNLNTLNEVGVWGINFDFTYKTDKLVYVGYEFAEDSVFTGYANATDNLTWTAETPVESITDVVLKANDYITYDEVKELYTVYRASATSVIKIGTNVANDENGKIVDAAVMGEELAVVTLYFEIVDKFDATQNADQTFKVTDKITGAFAITDVTAFNKDVEEVNAIADKASDITVNQFLNINNDGAVNFADVLAVWKMISGETEADYNVVVDVDKNGVVEAADFMAIYSYILGETAYADLVA